MDSTTTEQLFLEFTPAPTSRVKTKGTLAFKLDDKPLYSDSLDLARDKSRQRFIQRVLKLCPGLDENTTTQAMIDFMLEKADSLQKEPDKADDAEQTDNQPLRVCKQQLEESDPKIIGNAQEFLQSPDLIDRIISHMQGIGIAQERELSLMVYLIGTSRLLQKPLAGLVMGQSSAGKSYVIDRVARLFPDETVLKAHRITPRALEHMAAGSLIHRFVVAGERSRKQDDETAEATRALREMISEGQLSLLTTVRDSDGNHHAETISQQGPIAYIESTTLGIQEIFNEDRTRFILLCTDESPQQTQAVIDMLTRHAGHDQNPDMPDTITALHQTAQRLLEPARIMIPFSEKLRHALPANRIEARRTIGHLLSFIQTVALLHQFQRPKDGQGRIIASVADYEIVRKYLSVPLARSLGKTLTPGAEELLKIVKDYDTFTIAEAATVAEISYNTANSRIKELRNAGQIEMKQLSVGRNAAVYGLAEHPKDLEGLDLPEIKE
jgi:hypothetical protein